MNDFPNRKKLRLQGFDYSGNAYSFITLCTYERQRLFDVSKLDDQMYVIPSESLQNQILEKWLEELETKFSVTVDQYIVMSDHIHFILAIGEDFAKNNHGETLSDIMGWYKTMTTNEYIAYVKQGLLSPFKRKIWQKSYYDHIIRNYQDYLDVKKYLANNPIKEIYK